MLYRLRLVCSIDVATDSWKQKIHDYLLKNQRFTANDVAREVRPHSRYSKVSPYMDSGKIAVTSFVFFSI